MYTANLLSYGVEWGGSKKNVVQGAFFISYIDLIMEFLKDPGNTRVFKGLPLPPSRPLKTELLFQKGIIQVALLKEFLKKEGRVAFDDYRRIVKEAIHVFSTGSVIQNLNPILWQLMTRLLLLETSTGNFMIF